MCLHGTIIKLSQKNTGKHRRRGKGGWQLIQTAVFSVSMPGDGGGDGGGDSRLPGDAR